MSPDELQRHYRKGLCFYCHKPGHLTKACPKKSNSSVSLVQINTSTQSYKFIQVKAKTFTTSQTVGAFIDTRAEESFINATLAKDLGLKATNESVKVIMGNSSQNLGFRCATKLSLKIGQNLYPAFPIILKGLPHLMILGDLWSQRHGAILNF